MGNLSSRPSYWRWLFFGREGVAPAIKGFLSRWLLLDFVISLALLWSVDDVGDIAKSVALPFFGAIIGITFAWSGNITALLSTREISKLSQFHEGGIAEYVFKVQTSILVVLIAAIGWVLAALKIFDVVLVRFFIFFISCVSVRECWSMIMFAQYMTIYRDRIEKRDGEQKDKL